MMTECMGGGEMHFLHGRLDGGGRIHCLLGYIEHEEIDCMVVVIVRCYYTTLQYNTWHTSF